MNPTYPEVYLVEHTPNPERMVCLAARGDYSKFFIWQGSGSASLAENETLAMASIEGETIEEKRRVLILKLLKRRHFGPFEHVAFTFGIKEMSRACMAQLTRHRIASFDVQSLRYVNVDDMKIETDFHYPESLFQETVKSREGRKALTMSSDERIGLVRGVYEKALHAYRLLVEAGVPKEDARMVLPIGTRVNATMTLNARALMHMLDMRLAGDAQSEIRHLAQGLLDEAKKAMPITFEYYEDELHMRKNRLAP